jgi:hypothetical protein
MMFVRMTLPTIPIFRLVGAKISVGLLPDPAGNFVWAIWDRHNGNPTGALDSRQLATEESTVSP